jgi:hypothetical protein
VHIAPLIQNIVERMPVGCGLEAVGGGARRRWLGCAVCWACGGGGDVGRGSSGSRRPVAVTIGNRATSCAIRDQRSEEPSKHELLARLKATNARWPCFLRVCRHVTSKQHFRSIFFAPRSWWSCSATASGSPAAAARAGDIWGRDGGVAVARSTKNSGC